MKIKVKIQTILGYYLATYNTKMAKKPVNDLHKASV